MKTYLYHWLASLRALHPERIQTFLEPETKELDHRGGPRSYPAHLTALQIVNHIPAAWTRLFSPQADILHITNLLRNHLNAPILSATVHDLTSWTVPRFHRRSQVAADKIFAECVWRRARGLIAVSENTRQDAISILGINPERIRVIPPGVSDAYFSADTQEAARAAHACGLAVPYFLFTSTIEPRKNVDTLLDAWTSLPLSFRRETQLVLAGMPGWNSSVTMRRLAQLTSDTSGVRYLGYVPESLLPGLTSGAQALLYPSFYEGFGLPVAQAMAAGCPVITSNISSLPEVTGGAAQLIDPNSAGNLASAIRSIRESPATRARLTAAGKERARNFTWTAAAELSFRYFEELTG